MLIYRSPITAPGSEATKFMELFMMLPMEMRRKLKTPDSNPMAMKGIDITNNAIRILSRGIAKRFVIRA